VAANIEFAVHTARPTMPSSVQIRLRATIDRYQMMKSGDVVGVAVSGGADSVALLLLLKEMSVALGIRLVVLHFNHMLRGGESDGDETFVAELASQLGLEFFAGREDVSARARMTGSNLEDEARKCRYGFFASVVNDGRVGIVAVAHTTDDQAETVLAKMIRGTGPAGLAGIYPVRGHVVRPTLEVRRMELREYLKGCGQAWREDSTNLDESRLRARIRARLLPSLEQAFQPGIITQLSHLSTLARADEDFWAAFVEERFLKFVRRGQGNLSIHVDDLLAPLDLGAVSSARPGPLTALSTRLIRRILEELKGDLLGFTNRHVEDVLHLLTDSTSGHEIHLPGGIVVERTFEELRFARKANRREAVQTSGACPADPGFEHVLPLEFLEGQAVDIPEIGLRLRLKVIDWPAGERETKHKPTIADWERLRAPLVVRNWRPGDTIRLQGRQRTRKLKHLLRERRVAMHDRRNWPVLTSAGELVWTRGFPPARGFSASGETRMALVISEESL
jgi:tRNA(Ile)-lysidine synthase